MEKKGAIKNDEEFCSENRKLSGPGPELEGDGDALGAQPRQINFACNFCLKFDGTTPTEGDMGIASSLWTDVFHRKFCL